MGEPSLNSPSDRTTASQAHNIRSDLLCQQETAPERLGKALVAPQQVLVDSPGWPQTQGRKEGPGLGLIPLRDRFAAGLRVWKSV
jgi:hypothetical protein